MVAVIFDKTIVLASYSNGNRRIKRHSPSSSPRAAYAVLFAEVEGICPAVNESIASWLPRFPSFPIPQITRGSGETRALTTTLIL